MHRTCSHAHGCVRILRSCVAAGRKARINRNRICSICGEKNPESEHEAHEKMCHGLMALKSGIYRPICHSIMIYNYKHVCPLVGRGVGDAMWKHMPPREVMFPKQCKSMVGHVACIYFRNRLVDRLKASRCAVAGSFSLG